MDHAVGYLSPNQPQDLVAWVAHLHLSHRQVALCPLRTLTILTGEASAAQALKNVPLSY